MRLFAIFLSVILISLSSRSQEAATVASYDSKNLWLGPTVSLFVGFGVGVGLQGNYETRGWIYGSADLLSLVLIWRSITECHSPHHHDSNCPTDSNRKLANALFVTSRLAQLIDSSIWSYSYYERHHSTAFILPKEDGLSLNYTVEF